MKMLSKIILVLVVAVIGASIAQDNCTALEKWAPKCNNTWEMITMNNDLKQALLDKHNTLRNYIASGNLSNYKAAAKMPCLTWSDRLAERATLNVRQCKMRHDSCRSTNEFRNAGQNIAYKWSSGIIKSTAAKIAEMINGWFNEQANGGSYGWMSLIKKFNNTNTTGPAAVVGHFTQVVWENGTQVGCAAAKNNASGNNEMLLTCNYGEGNFIGRPVYSATDGKPASACPAGKVSKSPYTALCC